MMMSEIKIEQMMHGHEEKIEIKLSDYVKLHEELHTLRNRCKLLDTIIRSIMTALKNGGIE